MSQDNTPITTASDSSAQSQSSSENTFTSMWSSVSQWVGDMAANVQLPQVPRVELPTLPRFDVPVMPRIGLPIPGFPTPTIIDSPIPGIKIPGTQAPENPLPGGIKLPDISIIAAQEDEENQGQADEEEKEGRAGQPVGRGADAGNRQPAPGETIEGVANEDEDERLRRENEDEDEGLFDHTLSPAERREVQRLREADRRRIMEN